MGAFESRGPDGAARSALAQSRALNQAHKHAEAITVLTRALGRDPANPELTRELVYSLQKKGDVDAALRMSNRAIALDPANEWGHRLRAYALQSVGRDKEALAAAREAVRLEPHNFDAHYSVLDCQLRLRNAAGARQSLSRLLELDPNNLLSHQAAGEVAMLQKRWPQAEAALRRALAIDPNDANTLALLGTVLAPRKHGDDGLELIKSAMRTDPRSSFVGGLLIDEADRRFRPLGVVCTLVAIAGVFGAIIVLGRHPSTTRIVLSVLIAVLGLIVGLMILPRFIGRGRLDASVESYYEAESKPVRRRMYWLLAYFLVTFACFSAPMLAVSFIVDNQSPGFKVFGFLAFVGYLYVAGRFWNARVEPWLRSTGRLG
jgi:tetratricopeptide (TPR) repeat protein